jgi:hypothetical protein
MAIMLYVEENPTDLILLFDCVELVDWSFCRLLRTTDEVVKGFLSSGSRVEFFIHECGCKHVCSTLSLHVAA